MEWLLYPSYFGVTNFPAYLLGTIFIILLPGPNSLFVLTITTQKGWQAGLRASAGIFIGDAILMAGVAFGAASVLHASPTAFYILRTLGAAYLAWLGYKLFRGGIGRWQEGARQTSETANPNYLERLHPTLTALSLSLTNPKAIFFFISFFPQFISATLSSPEYAFIYLAIVLQIMSMSYLTGLIFAGQFFLSYFQKHPRHAALLWMLVGGLLIGFAVRLLL